MPLVLVVEDEQRIASVIGDYLKQAGMGAELLHRGDEVLPRLKKGVVDAVLLDIMLPGTDGITLLREIRTFSQLPILMITARIDEVDRLIGLELGADDYICKPFSPREVVARVKTVLRRTQASSSQQSATEIDVDRLQFIYQGQSVTFTAIEFHILKLLVEDTGRIYSRNQLIEHMYEDHRVVSDRTVDSHIKKLRQKLADAFPDQEFIYSVYGVGYKFQVLSAE